MGFLFRERVGCVGSCDPEQRLQNSRNELLALLIRHTSQSSRQGASQGSVGFGVAVVRSTSTGIMQGKVGGAREHRTAPLGEMMEGAACFSNIGTPAAASRAPARLNRTRAGFCCLLSVRHVTLRSPETPHSLSCNHAGVVAPADGDSA